MRIGVLALQGAYAEHCQMYGRMGVETVLLRNQEDLTQPFDGLVLPGGESSVQGKLMKDLGMLPVIRKRIVEGLPVMGTCAGAILLSEEIAGQETRYLQTLPARILRNAYGRQLGSFRHTGLFGELSDVAMEFVRAPIFEQVGEGVEVLAVVNHQIVAVRYGNQLALSFHPELTDDRRIHQYYLDMIHSFKVNG